jgi:hypothetical protein
VVSSMPATVRYRVANHSPPHELARQRFSRFSEAPVTRHVEQLVDDLLQCRGIDVAPEGLRRLAWGYTVLSGCANANAAPCFGQKVALRPDVGQPANRGEVFTVVRQPPETGSIFQYQIKSEIDGHVRAVREIQLTDLGSDLDAIKTAATTIEPTHSPRSATAGPLRLFFEIEADLTPVALFEQPSPSTSRPPPHQTQPGGLREDGDA